MERGSGMGQREDDAYRRGREQSTGKDSNTWVSSPKRTDAEKKAFTKGAADDLRQKANRKQASNGTGTHKVQQHTRETQKGKKTRVKQHTRKGNGTSQRRSTPSRNGRSRSGGGSKRPRRKTSLVHPSRAKSNARKAIKLRTKNGRKAVGFGLLALTQVVAYLLMQTTVFLIGAFVALLLVAATVIEDLTKDS